MKNKNIFCLLTFSLLFCTIGCGETHNASSSSICSNSNTSSINFTSSDSASTTTSGNLSSVTSTGQNSSLSSFTSATIEEFKTAIENTKNNYCEKLTEHEINNLDRSQSLIEIYDKKYSRDQQILKTDYCYVYTESEEEFMLNYNSQDKHHISYYHYNDDGKVVPRSQNSRGYWEDANYTVNSNVFTSNMVDYIVPEHFSFKTDGYFYINEEYLNGEEISHMTSFYGSYAYLNQDFEYFAFSIKDNKLDKFKYKVHFTARETEKTPYDAVAEIEGYYYEVGTTQIELPALHVYPEDLLVVPEELENAKKKAMHNYTYKEETTITDSEGNQTIRNFTEEVNDRNFHYYFYSDEAEAYIDDYTYDNKKLNFSGAISTTTYETVLVYYDDHTEYGTYDMDIEDDHISYLENLGSSFGTKIFKYDEENKCYIPINGMPDRYNPDQKTYLDYSFSFVFGVQGDYTNHEGKTYKYTYNDFKFYLNGSGDVYKVTYNYDLAITYKNEVTLLNYVGEGYFSNIGTTSYIVPSDPNDDIVVDEDLSAIIDSISLENYTYKETYTQFDLEGNQLNLSLETDNPQYQGIYNEYVADRYVRDEISTNVNVAEEGEDIRYFAVNDYYYYGDYSTVNSVDFGSYGSYSREYIGTYEFTPITGYLKDYLKFFKYSRTNTKGGKIYTLTGSYLNNYGVSLIGSVSNNTYLIFNGGITLQIRDGSIYSITYSYKKYEEDVEVGYVEGTITYSDFDSTEVTIPNFNESEYLNTGLEDNVSYLTSQSTVNTKQTTQVVFSGHNDSCIAVNYGNNNKVTCDSNNYYYDADGNLKIKFSYKDEEYDSIICSKIDYDLSKIKREQFYVDSNGNYNLYRDYLTEFYTNVLGFEGDNYLPSSASIEVTNHTIILNFVYLYRVALKDGTYAIFYITEQLIITTNKIMIN